MPRVAHIKQVFGVDFSGASDAGRKIWIAAGSIEDDTLHIHDCLRGATLPGSARARDRCLAALRAFIVRAGASIFGLDFPFGLPAGLIQQPRWEDFVRAFPDRYSDPDAFRQACFASADGRELKRVTDVEAQTPFSPYNLWLYRQTYFGLRDVLYPLVRDRAVSVLPMQRAEIGKPWLIEICPASTLKQHDLYAPYKGKSIERRAMRQHILRALKRSEPIELTASARSAALNDAEGDALDSIIAALAAFRAVHSPGLTARNRSPYALEGHVYV